MNKTIFESLLNIVIAGEASDTVIGCLAVALVSMISCSSSGDPDDLQFLGNATLEGPFDRYETGIVAIGVLRALVALGEPVVIPIDGPGSRFRLLRAEESSHVRMIRAR